jgi:radical SAM-linked protein
VRVRVRYQKSGKLRFISAIDLGRLWERALHKADLPIAFSEGFTPHPKISFADALPLGYASTGEYAELTFSMPVVLRQVVEALNFAFPHGISILDAIEVPAGAPRLATLLRASCWAMAYPLACQDGFLAESVDAVRAAEQLLTEHERKGLSVTVDVRPAIHHISSRGVCVRVTLHHIEPLVRPTQVHFALRSVCPGMPDPMLITRVAQGTPVDQGLLEALSGQLVPPRPAPTHPESARHAPALGQLT